MEICTDVASPGRLPDENSVGGLPKLEPIARQQKQSGVAIYLS